MSNSEILITVVLAAFLLYGIANMIAMPFISRKFFRENGFSETGKSEFEAYSNSELLQTLVAKNLYTAEYRGYRVKKAKCQLRKRSLFAFSKMKRRQLQSRWSITILETEQNLPIFHLMEKTDPNTVMRMLDDPGVDLSADADIDKRYLLKTNQTGHIVPLITGSIREFLMDSHLASIESLGNLIVIKRSWPIERLKDSLQAELDCAVTIAERLVESNSDNATAD